MPARGRQNSSRCFRPRGAPSSSSAVASSSAQKPGAPCRTQGRRWRWLAQPLPLRPCSSATTAAGAAARRRTAGARSETKLPKGYPSRPWAAPTSAASRRRRRRGPRACSRSATKLFVDAEALAVAATFSGLDVLERLGEQRKILALRRVTTPVPLRCRVPARSSRVQRERSAARARVSRASVERGRAVCCCERESAAEPARRWHAPIRRPSAPCCDSDRPVCCPGGCDLQVALEVLEREYRVLRIPRRGRCTRASVGRLRRRASKLAAANTRREHVGARNGGMRTALAPAVTAGSRDLAVSSRRGLPELPPAAPARPLSTLPARFGGPPSPSRARQRRDVRPPPPRRCSRHPCSAGRVETQLRPLLWQSDLAAHPQTTAIGALAIIVSPAPVCAGSPFVYRLKSAGTERGCARHRARRRR